MLKFETKNRKNTCYQTNKVGNMLKNLLFNGSSKKEFTLAEGATHVDISHNSSNFGFTLAEVLITLGIIGVVAAITMPILVQNVQSRVKAKRIENIHQKLSKATDKMAVQSGLIGYGSTMAFVQELSKHIKLAKVCDNDHLALCWPTNSVITRDSGATWNISETKTPKDLKINYFNQKNYDNTVGIITADGTSMILSYKKDCDFDLDTKGLVFDKNTSTSNTLSCMAGILDWNGGKNPNKLGDDVITIGSAGGLGNSCVFETKSGLCITSKAHVVTGVSKDECYQLRSQGAGIGGCWASTDYWAGAVAECGGSDNLFDQSEFKQIENELYSSGQYNNEIALKLGLPTLPPAKTSQDVTGYSIWAKSDGTSINASSQPFSNNKYYNNFGSSNRALGSGYLVLCKGD